MVVGVVATLASVIGMWIASRFGWSILPTIGTGYVVWGATLALIHVLRQMLSQ
jgi:hypothetical protein